MMVWPGVERGINGSEILQCVWEVKGCIVLLILTEKQTQVAFQNTCVTHVAMKLFPLHLISDDLQGLEDTLILM